MLEVLDRMDHHFAKQLGELSEIRRGQVLAVDDQHLMVQVCLVQGCRLAVAHRCDVDTRNLGDEGAGQRLDSHAHAILPRVVSNPDDNKATRMYIINM